MDSTPKTMKAVVTLSEGDYDVLSYCDVPVPSIKENEVLIKVLSCAINQTDINTRIGWYSGKDKKGGGWQGKTIFPLIQGTDCCGIIVEVGSKVLNPDAIIGKRVLVRPCQKTVNPWESVWMASDFNGAFAEYVSVRSSEVFVLNSDWKDEELGSIPCSYGTSENMLQRANVKKNEVILVVGASGGVGSATIQLAKRRQAKVYAITSEDKKEQILSLGCDKVFVREDDILKILGEKSVDVVFDNVAGKNFKDMIKLLKKGGKYVTSGAIAGSDVELDLRTLYLNDLTLIGCTFWEENVFPNLIRYIENNEIKPLVAKVFKLQDIAIAQKEFLKKLHIGKIVLVP